MVELYTPQQLAFCHRLPKVELHAHLNGSVRDQTIRELAAERGVDCEVTNLLSKGHRTLSECFKLFDAIHRITTDHATITRITCEVVQDFAADNVIYLELRTTPKARPEHGMTKRSYLEAVLAGMQQASNTASASPKQVMVRLLLSIDRRESTQASLETVALAAEYRAQGVVGIDLSGNPSVGSFDTWLPALQRARELALKLTLHAAEVYRPEETVDMLALRPDRLGHMCCLDDALEQQMVSANIPVELCLSSNVITESVPGYADHHFQKLYQAGHPVVLCTDDSGVFCTSLSREYAITAQAFQLSDAQLTQLSLQSIEHTFLDKAGKEQLRQRFQALMASS
ncbi:hypothetical protein WJX72_011389 [[Myrmecia] bisecta]|uniref:Adenosine deaminase domain-containing protein n=1 Tax=[Myrmecia] bisecta TaxID=41462 RepID=A0AAW1PK47_9CHLO